MEYFAKIALSTATMWLIINSNHLTKEKKTNETFSLFFQPISYIPYKNPSYIHLHPLHIGFIFGNLLVLSVFINII